MLTSIFLPNLLHLSLDCKNLFGVQLVGLQELLVKIFFHYLLHFLVAYGYKPGSFFTLLGSVGKAKMTLYILTSSLISSERSKTAFSGYSFRILMKG
jgi:hypothetical protein